CVHGPPPRLHEGGTVAFHPLRSVSTTGSLIMGGSSCEQRSAPAVSLRSAAMLNRPRSHFVTARPAKGVLGAHTASPLSFAVNWYAEKAMPEHSPDLPTVVTTSRSTSARRAARPCIGSRIE